MNVLGIESSCDECSAAVVQDGRRILSNVVLSQVDFHKPYYGVVPEIASRKHVEWIRPVVMEGLAQAGMSLPDIDAIAVTCRPCSAMSSWTSTRRRRTSRRRSRRGSTRRPAGGPPF